jgi:multidrug efflux system membrane fusion protein
MPATIKIWATNQNYTGKIRLINQASDQQTRTYTARIQIINPDANIKYGMAADVFVTPLNLSQGDELPLGCLYANEGKSYVWQVESNSTAKLVPIQVMATDGVSMRIKPGALQHGDVIVNAGTNLLHNGQKLKVYND